MRMRFQWLFALFALAAVVFLAYAPAFQFGFYGDDWIFFELAGRLSLGEYLVKYFDPRVQTAWYRPVQGVLWRVGYTVFGANPLGYHAVNIFLHLANVFVLFALVQRETRNVRLGFVAALIFATLPTAALAVFWAGVVDPLETFFYLAAIWFWLAYLRDERVRDFVLTQVAFLLALFSKEISVTLPVTLFLLDRFFIARPASLGQLARRYALFAFALIPFGVIEWIVTRRSVFVNREGYSPTMRIAQNLIDYFSALAFPWGFFPPLSYVWLALGAFALAFLIFARRRYVLIPLVVSAALAIAPVAPFPFVAHRFLYLSLVAFAVLFACAFDWLASRLPRVILFALLAVIVAWGGVSIANAAAEYAEAGRVARVPFRNVRQAHPTLPDDTYFYFLHPPVPGPNLSGMFFWYYGTRVVASANDSGQPARLRDHANAYVIYWDAQGNQKEQRVEQEPAVRASAVLPIEWGNIRLEGYEIARAHLQRGEPLIILLYWRAARETTVSMTLVARTQVVASIQRIVMPRVPGELVIDAVILPLALDAGAYRLDIAVDDTHRFQIEPIVIIE